ncbi:hypothetical protein [Ruminococcus sp.]|uniref:hypothetical protein n=1 Tax=Ruminococcus sp. TaxID=41978 RepID=UPI001B6FF417|nr:hypothetical protein [Ruminococcus sp.]MBP5431587.1 hypothetical protein [Ruminococcus sp.]
MSTRQKAALIADKVMRLAFLCRMTLVVSSEDVLRDFGAEDIDFMYRRMYPYD